MASYKNEKKKIGGGPGFHYTTPTLQKRFCPQNQLKKYYLPNNVFFFFILLVFFRL